MAGAVWYEVIDIFKDEYGLESNKILDDLVGAMDVREAETNICYLAQQYDISIEDCKDIDDGKYYVGDDDEDDY